MAKKKLSNWVIALIILLILGIIALGLYLLFGKHYSCYSDNTCKWRFSGDYQTKDECKENCGKSTDLSAPTNVRKHCLNVRDNETNNNYIYCKDC